MVYSAIYINSYWCRIHTNKALHIPSKPAQPTSPTSPASPTFPAQPTPPTKPSLIKLNQIKCIDYDLGGKCKIDFGL
jgi:hypothetical protein